MKAKTYLEAMRDKYTEKTTIFLTPELAKRLLAQAVVQNISREEICEIAISFFLDRLEMGDEEPRTLRTDSEEEAKGDVRPDRAVNEITLDGVTPECGCHRQPGRGVSCDGC